MPVDLSSVGTNAANGAVGAIMGLALEKHNDKRQIKQQTKLQNLQIQGQKSMIDYNMAKELEMWKNTSYEAQKEQMIKAGLNPGLMYGMGGGGGQSIGSPGGNVSGAEAPKGGGEAMGMGIQMMNLQLMKAQKENIEADTANKKADVPVKTAQEGNITQDTENKKANLVLTKIQAELARVDLGFQRATYDERINYITDEARKIQGEANSALIQGNVDEATRQTKEKTIKAEYVQRLLENAYITAKTKGEYQSIKESEAETLLKGKEFEKIANDIMLGWENLSNEHQKIDLLRSKISFDTDPSNTVLEGLSRGIGTLLLSPINKGMEGTSNPVRGFHKR